LCNNNTLDESIIAYDGWRQSRRYWTTHGYYISSLSAAAWQCACQRGQLEVIESAPAQHVVNGTDVVLLIQASPPGANRQSRHAVLNAIKPVVTVKDLGLRLDAAMSTWDHIRRLTSTCVGCVDIPWQIQYYIRRSLLSHARTMLVTCFVFA